MTPSLLTRGRLRGGACVAAAASLFVAAALLPVPLLAQEKPDAPAEKKPDAPAEKKPDAPAEKKPDAPAEKKPDAPAEKKPDAPAEKKPDAPAEKPKGEKAPDKGEKAPDKGEKAPDKGEKKPEKPEPPKATEIPTGVEYPIKIQTSVWVNSVSKIDEVEGTFTAEIDVRLRWNDARLAFDAKATGADRLEFGFEEAAPRIATMWTPGVTIANMDKNPTEDRVGVIIYAKGTAELFRRMNAKFKSPLDFSRFPFDRQRLLVELRSPRYGASQVVFSQDADDRNQSGVKSGTAIPNWHFDRNVGFTVSTRRGWTGRDHNFATAELTARRETGQYFFQLFLPFFTIMLFPPLALWVPKAEVMPRANMAFSGLFSLIALSYSIFVRYPMLAAVDNVIVRMLWLGYVFLASVLVLIMTVHNPAFTSNFRGKHVWAEAASWTTWSVPILFAIAIGSTILFSL